MGRIEAGAHLGVVRNWLKWHAKNGETVTWGSDETLEMKRLTPRDMEQLAQDIADAVREEDAVKTRAGIEHFFGGREE